MIRRSALLLFAIAAVLIVGMSSLQDPPGAQASVATFIVTALDDVNDGTCDPSLGGHCSLREAMLAANSNGNPNDLDVISFNVPAPHTIKVNALLPQVTEPVHISGESQPGASCPLAGRTLLIEIFTTGGPYNAIEVTHGGTVGSIISGVAIHGFDWNAVNLGGGAPHTLRCSHLGLNAAGTEAPGNGFSGVSAHSAPGVTIGGDLPRDRNVFAGNSRGISLLFTSGGATVRNNYFGILADGVTQASHNEGDIFLSTSNDVDIQANRFGSGGSLASISMVGSSSGHIIRLNSFGLDATDTPFAQRPLVAVDIAASTGQASTGHQVGGTANGQANRIAVSTAAVQLRAFDDGDISGVTIRGNAIDVNTTAALGIDLRPDGSTPGAVQPNDLSDSDDGPNGLQNFPVLLDAANGTSTVNGELSSAPLQDYDIDFYANAACASGREGQRFLGSLPVSTNGAGYTTFSTSSLDSFSAAEGITATATDANGNTSEFSACIPGGVKNLSSLAPTEAVAGSADTLVTLTGSAFVVGDTATFGGNPVATTYVNSTTLQITVTPAMKPAPGTRFVEVQGAIGQRQFHITRSSSDTNCDGLANASDASSLLRVLAGIDDEHPDCPADANKSGGDTDIADVLHIRHEVAGLVQPMKSLFQ